MPDERPQFVDRTAQRFAVCGIVVGAVALIGIDPVLGGRSNVGHPKASGVVVRVVSSANAAALAAGPAFGAATLALAILLWVGRHAPTICPPRSHPILCIAGAPDTRPAVKRRFAISYHIGGLYGP